MTAPTRGLFVTGTDTGVGKTTFSAGLLRLAARRGLRVFPLKPAETGWNETESDADLLRRAARSPLPLEDICPIRLPVPVAPAEAAALAGAPIDIDGLVAHALRARQQHALLVEGAGGLLVPYAPGITAADLALRLRLPIVVIARAALGTINHTALTVAEARRRGLHVAAIVLVAATALATPAVPSNPGYITDLTGLRPLGTIPFLSDLDRRDPDRLADALERSVDVGPLLELLGGQPPAAS